MNGVQVLRRRLRHRWDAAVVSLTVIVLIWWLLVAAVAVQTLPAPAVSAPKDGATASSGQTARIHLPGLPSLPIPVERIAFDQSQRGFRESDEDAIEHAFTAYAWIEVSHHQSARVVSIDGEAVEVELLEGRHAGRRGWLKTRHLVP